VGQYWNFQRQVGAHYLANLALSPRCRGDFTIAYPESGGMAFFVHSKVMICDDEFVLIGSANINQRSMTHDSEIQLGIVDANNEFARNLRKTLLGEHLQVPTDRRNELDDPDRAYERFKSGEGRVRPYTPSDPGDPPIDHGYYINHLLDPYGGPIQVQSQ
jgi:phosphatidylserine/phosphatidylglycerophosphate/cardiolipin synthase-like enzyme